MAFLTALGYAAGGYGAGMQQRRNYQLEQQREANTQVYEQAQIAAERLRAQREDVATRANLTQAGFDASGNPLPPLQIHLPPNLMRIVPGKVGTRYKVTPQDVANHQIAVARYVAQQHRNAGRVNEANAKDATADELEKLLISENAETARFILDLYNQGQQNQRAANSLAGADARSANVLAAALERVNIQQQGANTRNVRTVGGANYRTQAQIAAANKRSAASISEKMMAQSANDIRAMNAANGKARSDGKPLPFPALDDPNLKYQAALSDALRRVSSDPGQLQHILTVFQSKAAEMGPQLLLYATRQLQNAAQQARQAQEDAAAPQGGSDADGNPQYPGP